METEYFSFRLRLFVTGTWVCYKILKSLDGIFYTIIVSLEIWIFGGWRETVVRMLDLGGNGVLFVSFRGNKVLCPVTFVRNGDVGFGSGNFLRFRFAPRALSTWSSMGTGFSFFLDENGYKEVRKSGKSCETMEVSSN